MGKMMEALKKSEAYKNAHLQVVLPQRIEDVGHASEPLEERVSPWQHMMQAAVIIVFLVIGVTSIIFNFTTVSELARTKKQAEYFSGQLHGQKEQLSQLSLKIEELTAQNKDKADRVAILERTIGQVQQDEMLKTSKINMLSSQNDILQEHVKELAFENQTLRGQFKSLNEEAVRLREFIKGVHAIISNPIQATAGRETKESPTWEN